MGPPMGPPFGPPFGPPGMPFIPPGQVILQESRSRTPSPSQTPSTLSPRPSFVAPMFPPSMPGPVPPGFPVPPPGFPVQPMPPPVTAIAPSRRSPDYRSPSRRESPRLYPTPSRAPSHYSERPMQFFPPPVPIPAGIPHIEPRPYSTYRGRTRYSDSRTPSSERDRSDSRERRRRRRRRRSPDRSLTPSDEYEEERRRDRRSRRYRSPSPVYPIQVGVPTDRGAGPVILPQPAGVHIHTGPPPSPTELSRFTEPETEPLRHPFGEPTQYLPPEQVPVPTGRAPSGRTRPSRAPTIIEALGPEPIHVLPPDHGRPRTISTRKYFWTMQHMQLIELFF